MLCKLILSILLFINFQGPLRVESLSTTNVTLEKLRSIVSWLDKLSDATIFDYIYRVNRGVGLNLFEGDIKGYNPRQSLLRTAIKDHRQLWNTRTVPYLIDNSFDSASRKDILAAIEEYHAKTCIRFVPRSTETDYIHFKQINGCYSNIGRTGGGQDISLMGACLKKGTAIHEMMHALGFWHEQSRPDRDGWVRIIKGNIKDGMSYNFDKLSTDQADTLGVPYDYGSVMHYSKYAFSKNGNPTIQPIRTTDAELGQRDGLSDHDVLRIKMLYRCDSTAQTVPTPVVTNPSTTVKPVKTEPPKTDPPKTDLPKTDPPKTDPPKTDPPKTAPAQTNKPQTNPPVTAPPVTNPPITKSPVTAPPSTKQPQTALPVTQPVATHPPQIQTQTVPHKPVETTQRPATTVDVVNTSPSATAPQTTQLPVAPVYHAGWTTWSLWSPCDLQCRHSRYRFCLNYDQNYCPGENSQVTTCPAPCKPAMSLGCWKQNSSSLSIPSVEGMDASLSGPYKERRDPIRACADYAAVNGYVAFAVFDKGQCLTGPDAPTAFSQGRASGDCGYKGIGATTANNVYSFETDIDGQWSLWTGWGQCTKTCGMGRQYRYRRCDNPAPAGSGAICPGNDHEVAICDVGPCIVPTQCGSEYHAGGPGTSGLIWVRDYDNFMECSYRISTGDPMATISVYIHQLDVEYSKGCIYDSLMLHDGSSYRSPLVGSFCGNNPPGAFESTTNNVYLKFESDETNTAHGYTIFYNINSRSRKACVKPPQSAHATMQVTGNMVSDQIWYVCHQGYKMVGHSPITCVDQPGFALWDDLFPRCVAVRKRSTTDDKSDLCSFEDNLCGFTNYDANTFNWTVQRSNYPTTNMSIVNGDRGGNYLQAVSTRLQEPGASSVVRTSIANGNQDSQCLEMSYKIDGGDMAALNLYTAFNKTDVDGNHVVENKMAIWQTFGSDENEWLQYRVDFTVTEPFQIIFEAVLGDEIGSAISIDDITIRDGLCGE